MRATPASLRNSDVNGVRQGRVQQQQQQQQEQHTTTNISRDLPIAENNI
jgi:hypothetical protein